MARKKKKQTGDPQDPPEVGCAWALVLIALISWGLLLTTGYFDWSVTRRQGPISPYFESQWRYYIAYPLVMTILSAVQLLALFVVRQLAWIVVILSGLAVLGLAPYAYYYAIGV